MEGKFKFEKCPSLKGIYDKYYKLTMVLVKWSMKSGPLAEKQLKKAEEEVNQYGYQVLAPAIYDAFNPLKPQLYKRRGEGQGYYNWDEVFDKPYDQLDVKKRKCLIGLIEGSFVYELPSEYYND